MRLNQGLHGLRHAFQLPRTQIALEDAVLHGCAEAQQSLAQALAPLVVRDVEVGQLLGEPGVLNENDHLTVKG